MSTFASSAQRGLAVRELLPLLPAHVVADVQAFLQSDGPTPDLDLMPDLARLLNRPLLRDWSAAYPRPHDAQATLVACFVRTVCDSRPPRLAGYVRCLLGDIQQTLRPAAQTFRLTRDPDFRQALTGPSYLPLALSSLAPLAMFFLQSVARAGWAWDTLLDSTCPPPSPHPFGWLPAVDGLGPTLRFLLIAQCGRTFRPNALLYSPLARHLIDQGLAQRVRVLRGQCPACGYRGDQPACPACALPLRPVTQPWLLATAYLRRCTFVQMPDHQPAVLLNDCDPPGRSPTPPPDSDLLQANDRLAPGDLGELARMKRLARQAVTRLLDILRNADRPRPKALILWAQAANLNDPAALPPGPPQPPVADAMIEAIIAPELPGRADRLPQLNRQLAQWASRTGQPTPRPFTGNQIGACLFRLRKTFMEILQDLVRSDF